MGVGLSGSLGQLVGVNVTTGTPVTATGSPVTEPSANGGTSGIVVDNISSAAQAASIYFTTLAAGTNANCGTGNFCAVKLTQSGLQ